MFTITKITQRHDPTQDRIALIVEDASGKILLLWLTQRLSNRLATTLSGWIDERIQHEMERQKVGSQSSVTAHTWEQWSARSHMTAQKPVEVEKKSEETLIEKLNISRGTKGCAVTFQWGSNGSARLSLDFRQLRQWLIALYAQYRAAGWSTKVWPEWITIGEEKTTVSANKYEIN
jgi:hypothetical protein